jgi:hypothetical protein
MAGGAFRFGTASIYIAREEPIVSARGKFGLAKLCPHRLGNDVKDQSAVVLLHALDDVVTVAARVSQSAFGRAASQ